MSEGDVSLIHDEDVLRRMWQQTEDFSRKKEIRAHMYRLREERLRNLYSPEPHARDAKGCEFSAGEARGHGRSFADQSFQSLKSKEVRDAGSPPKEFSYSGQDLKELSNAGWNVESENKTTDDGHTHVKSVNANIEGRYDVEGGKGQFAAVDQHRQAITEYQDDNTSLKRNESSSNTAAHEQVVRQTDDGSHFSSTKTSSSASSKFQQVSSTKHESVPYITNDDYTTTRQDYDSNNVEQSTRKVTKTSEHEQNLRSYDGGELVSRKVEYPDSNTKVIVETRELADGTRVTSTRREFRAPAVSTARSESYSQQTRSENKSYTSSHKSDVRDTTSRNISNDFDSRITNIVDSQRNVDDYDFKRNQKTDHTTTVFEKDEHVDTTRQKTNQQRYTTNVDEANQHEVSTSRDTQRVHDNKTVEHNFDNQERIHHVTTDKKVEEVVQRKISSDQYQTTYQSEFSQKKISQDLSPTHQAWASTLRGDSPISSRPTTRASSPGSRTYQSSTSSLRSSVSPDKTIRKPSSRGGSPSKIDRSSPSRNTSERYSSTHSTHSVTETKTNKYTSPDGRPPHHNSPTRYNASPDRKVQNSYRQRPSVSPEKRPQDAVFRPSISPDRKTGHRSSPSPTRINSPAKPSEKETSPTRKSPYHSPERKPYLPSENKSSPNTTNIHSAFPSRSSKTPEKEPTDNLKNNSRPSQSPDRKPGYQTPFTQSRASPEKSPNEPTPSRASVSPDRKPGYMRPTANKQNSLPSPTKSAPCQSPERKPYNTANTTSIKEDHYKFIDEETKMYTRSDKTNIDYTSLDKSTVRHGKSPSPTRKLPGADTPDHCRPESPSILTRPSLRKESRSPSPPKGPVTFSQDQRDIQHHNVIHETKKNEIINISTINVDKQTKTTSDIKNTPTSPKRNTPIREPSPTKYDTYDKKTRRSEEFEDKKTMKTNTFDQKYDSLARRETSTTKTSEVDTTVGNYEMDKPIDVSFTPKKDTPIREPSPSKFGTYEKKKRRSEEVDDMRFVNTKETKEDRYDSLTRREKSTSPRKAPETPSSPTKKSSRNSTSPLKSPTKSEKYQTTTNFITREKFTEETNKNTTRKEHPRQLVTPSTSPTRKPKTVEKEPSTGQSSPTTSVSGFVYFSSPPLQKTIVTDLDDAESYYETNTTEKTTTTYKRPDDLPLSRSPSPSKIPCRSPSPEKKILPTKETLPRKSSLKKPSTGISQISPTEKPPSTFLVSPTVEIKDLPEHKVVNKDHPGTPETTAPVKVKPPFERRETYEERCRKILGMMEDTNKSTSTVTVTNDSTSFLKKPESNRSSPSVSPCVSPGPKETSPIREGIYEKVTKDSHKVIDFIVNEQDDLIRNTEMSREKTPTNDRKSKTPSRESSPTKLQDIITKTVTTSDDFTSTSNVTTEKTFDSKGVENKYQSPRSSVSPVRKTPERSTNVSNRSDSPIKKIVEPKSRTPSPVKKNPPTTKATTDLITLEREQEILNRVHNSLRNLSPNRSERSPSREKSPGKSTTSLQDLDITTATVETNNFKIDEEVETNQQVEVKGKTTSQKSEIDITVKSKDVTNKSQKPTGKPLSRTVSPVKKTSSAPTSPKTEKSSEAPVKARSTSPRKPVSSTEVPQSPQAPKTVGKSMPAQLTRKPTPTTINIKTESVISTEMKKSTGVSKQNTVTKTSPTRIHRVIPSPTRATELDNKRYPTNKGSLNKENVSPKKDDVKVSRTASDISIKIKKTTPQRMKSKPEIQVSDLSTKSSKQSTTTKNQKSTIEEPQMKLASKPKSATSLNTSMDDDDVLIDVEQAKSSRENSPDRICPTPISFLDDVQTPRLPDEVSEPDDEFVRRTHHTIHETESLVDDIIEISEDDELFVKRTQVDNVTESDECLLSVNDKVSKFTNKIGADKPKDTTKHFKDTERRLHSDYIEDNLKSDECLLSVSQKVNKFAKGSRDTKDSRSPSRRVTDEYDVNTVYQDDYTKLSVNDKAHLFVETAENVKTPKTKPAKKVERPDLNDVEESLKSDDCLLSVSDKVNKFVKTAEQFLQESHNTEDKERKIKEQHEEIMRKMVENYNDDTVHEDTEVLSKRGVTTEKKLTSQDQRQESFSKVTASSQVKNKDYATTSTKPIERIAAVKITTLRSSEAVKKAKALFENIATTQKTKETVDSKTPTKTAKLTDIGVIKKSPKTDSTIVLHPSLEDGFSAEIDEVPAVDKPDTKDRPSSSSLTRPQRPGTVNDKPRDSPTRLAPHSPQIARTKSPMRQTIETATTTRTVISRHPTANRPESPKYPQAEVEKPEKPQEKVPGYQRPTQTSQIREDIRSVEDVEVSSRRGSGKFGVELRRTSAERSTVSSERRRSSVEHHQPCIEDIFDLDLLEQMLEKVVGYEQRRRIRAQIRVAKKKMETEHVTDSSFTKTTKHTFVSSPRNRSPAERQTKPKSQDRHLKPTSPERHFRNRTPERARVRSPERHAESTPIKITSPERHIKIATQKTVSPDRYNSNENSKPIHNGHTKEPVKVVQDKRQRPVSPEKPAPKTTPGKTKSPVRQRSPDKKTRTLSPSKTVSPKPKTNRFNEYASAYMKKVGLNETEKLKFSGVKNNKTVEHENQKNLSHHSGKFESKQITTTKSFTERTSSSDRIETHLNGKRSPSPQKQPERRSPSPLERMHQRSPSPEWKIPKSETIKKETIIKTTYEVDKKPKQEEKPSWVMNRNLKKTTSEMRTFSSKRLESEKTRRATSPSKTFAQPLDVITSSYGPGPLDADGRPLFGIKALRNGASNYQVKGTVVRQEFVTRNGGAPEGSVSVTAYASEPAALEQLLRAQGEPPSRLHGLAAITTTKKFGGDSGHTYREAHTKEERATLEQFTHSDRRVEGADSSVCITDVSDTRADRAERITDKIQRVEKVGRVEKMDRTERLQREKTERNERIADRTQRIADRTEKVVDRAEKNDRTERTEKKEKVERREDRKTVRQSSVKSLTEKYIKSASDTSKSERSAYPKAGLILRSAGLRDSVSSDSSQHGGLARTDSEHSLGSVEEVVTTRTTTSTTRGAARAQERSFLDSTTKVTGVQDILTRMKNADIVIEAGDTSEDTEARALLNKFLGATVLMAGMKNYVADAQAPRPATIKVQETRTVVSQRGGPEFDPDQCWDERVLKKLLEESTDYEQRRRLRVRIRTLMAEQEACASAVTEALAAAGEGPTTAENSDARGESLLLPLLQGLLGGGGERLLAGLGAAGADVVADVRRSLGRLRAALAPPAAHPQARALLTLAERLEDALDAADRLDGCKKRPRRRRAARHTVGVTQEELEEARRLVDRDQLALAPAPSGSTLPSSAASTASVPSVEQTPTPERRPSVDDVSYHEPVPAQHKRAPVAHSVSYEPAPVSRDAQLVERRAPAPRKPDFHRHSSADAQPALAPPPPRPVLNSKSGIAKIANKFNAQIEREAPPPQRRVPARQPPPVSAPTVQARPPPEEPYRAPLYKPLPATYNFAAPPAADDFSKPLSRFNSNKRLRMKRANTIDIGKPLGGYRRDSDTDEDAAPRGPAVPELRPQTENDRKFLAFMKKNEENVNGSNGHVNWSNRFGNIKNTFENRDQEDRSRSSSASSAKRFWRAAEESPPSHFRQPRRVLGDFNSDRDRPRVPWAAERRDISPQVHPPPAPLPPPPVPQAPPKPVHHPPAPPRTAHHPPIPQSPTKPIAKPFAAKPIPVNQFSHAPMSAFKPPQKIMSPVSAPALVWSPPSASVPFSPPGDSAAYPASPARAPSPPAPAPAAPWAHAADRDKPRRVLSLAANRFENNNPPPRATVLSPQRERPYGFNPPTPPTYAPPPAQNYPVKAIPSQNDLAAPGLVNRLESRPHEDADPYVPKVDAQKLQIEFYEKQIREKKLREPISNGHYKPPAPQPPPYTVTDFTPAGGVSTFVPLQQTPDIEKARAHKVDYLPDVVLRNEAYGPPAAGPAPAVPRTRSPYAQKTRSPYGQHNGDAPYTNGHGPGPDDEATEHSSVVTRVMRGPVSQSATITAGARSRHDPRPRGAPARAADDLRGALDKISAPRRDSRSQEEEVTTVTTSARRNSSEKTVSSSTTTRTSKVIESMTRPGPKPVSPFAKFRQLEKQNSTNSPNSPQTPKSPGSPSQPYFKFTDPALQASAATIKERLLQWCRDKTRDYENVKLENFSTSWADGLAFCALLHHFLPDAFDYTKLTPEKRRHNFTLAFKVADEKAGIYPLLDVDDMVAMRKPDWKCVFTYVQSIHRRFKDDR